MKSCRIIVRCDGYDLIDVSALNKAGIAFSNTPDYGTEEVADTAASMILHHVRRIGEYDYQCRHFVRVGRHPETPIVALQCLWESSVLDVLVHRYKTYAAIWI